MVSNAVSATKCYCINLAATLIEQRKLSCMQDQVNANLETVADAGQEPGTHGFSAIATIFPTSQVNCLHCFYTR